MHEMGVLMQIVKTVGRITEQNSIKRVKYITLEVGDASGFVPMYMTKMFPAAADAYSVLADAELRINIVSGRGLVIKDIGY